MNNLFKIVKVHGRNKASCLNNTINFTIVIEMTEGINATIIFMLNYGLCRLSIIKALRYTIEAPSNDIFMHPCRQSYPSMFSKKVCF